MIVTLPEQHPSEKELQKLHRGKPQRFAAVKKGEEPKSKAKPKRHEPPKALPEETKYELWAEKYRPKSSDELVGNPSLISELREWLKMWHLGTVQDLSKKAVLISGPPGIGKTSAAWAVARETGFEPIEMNASDTRTRSFLEEHVEDATHNKTIVDFFTAKKVKKTKKEEETPTHKKPCLIMDEVDGIYERGGITELIDLIKKSQIPIICICNDRYSPKLKSLATHCIDMKFKRPSVVQCLPRVMRIAQLEGFEGDTLTLEKILESCHGDLRQALNMLQVWSAEGLNYKPEIKDRLQKRIGKDASLTPIDAVMQLFLNHGKHVPVQEKIDLYFVDPNLEPLLVQENYLDVNTFIMSNPKEHGGYRQASMEYMNAVSRAADWISNGDVLGKNIYKEQNFELMREHAVVSTVAPAEELNGFIEGAPQWPSWFGKTSHMKGNYSRLHYLYTHIRHFTTADSTSFCLDYLPVILQAKIAAPMKEPGEQEGTNQVIEFMDAYDLDQEDLDVLFELGQMKRKGSEYVPAGVKNQLTKQIQHHEHMKHTARDTDASKVSTSKRGKKKKQEPLKEKRKEKEDHGDEVTEDKELPADE